MAYVAYTSSVCHCKACWNLADVSHGTLGGVFTVRALDDDGVYEHHVLRDGTRPIGFKTKAAAEAALEAAIKETTHVSIENSEAKAWRRLADYYKKLAADRADEGTSVQLACLVLAEHCVHEWSTDRGGPTDEMVALAENTADSYLDEMLAAELNKDGAS